MSNSVMSIAFLQQSLDIVTRHGHGGGHRAGEQKFAEMAQAQLGVPFITPQAVRPRELPQFKKAQGKERRSRDQAREERPQRRPANSNTVDITV